MGHRTWKMGLQADFARWYHGATLRLTGGAGRRRASADTSMMSFGALLRQHRLAAQLTQEELAERASVSTRSVSDIERGISHTPQKVTVRTLAEALCLAGEDLKTFEATARASRRTIDPAQQPGGASLLAPEATVVRADTGIQRAGSAAWRSRLKRPAWVMMALVAALTFPLAFTFS